MKPNEPRISLTPYDDIFSTEESRNPSQGDRIQEIQLSELFPFKDHPFSVTDDKKMMEMVEILLSLQSLRLITQVMVLILRKNGQML